MSIGTGTQPIVLIGRDVERQVIARLVAGARVAQSGVLVLVGEPGIGKTALLEDAASRAAGMTLLRAAGTEAEREVPFGGLLQLLRPALGQLARIPPPQARALGIALALADGDGETAGGDRFAVGAATLSLLSRFAEEHPLAILVDDAHLLDRSSAEALTFAARRLVADQIVMLAALRPGPATPFAEAGLPELVLPGLALAAAEQLLSGLGDQGHQDREWVSRLHRDTGGNPLAMKELAADPVRLEQLSPEAPIPAPATLAQVFGARIAQLPRATQDVLLVSATAGGDLAVVAGACQRLGQQMSALIPAERADLVTITAGRVEFRHPLIRSAVYGDADPDRRRATHAATAAVLGEHDPRRAWHRSEAALGPDESIAADLARVGGQSRARSAYAVAATAYERAARLTPDLDPRALRLVSAGENAWLAGRTDRAGRLLAEALALAPPVEIRARAQELRGSIAARQGSLSDARDILVRTAQELPAALTDQAVVMLADAVNVCFFLGDAASALRVAGELDRLLVGVLSPRARILGTMAGGMALVLAGRGGVAQIRSAMQQLGASSALTDDPLRAAWLCLGPMWLRESEAGRHLVQRVVDDLRERAAASALPYLLFLIARDDATTDRWAGAETEYDEGIRLARETHSSTELAISLAGLAWLHARLGRETDCRAGAAEAIRISQANDIHIGRVWARFALGELELGLGRPQAAIGHWQELTALLDEIGVLDADLSPAPELVDTLLRLGRTTEAAAQAERYLEIASAKGQPWALARAERALGLAGPDAEVDRHFEAALHWHAKTLDVYEDARSRLAYGSRLRRLRRRADARGPLRRALETFDRLGARPWADAAAAELRATGETVQRRGAAAAALTPQEQQIAAMLADGRTTRQAAAAMFLSPKTVEYHLRHVYTKLGVASRSELASVLAGPKPPPR
jgi:DNA-binding CsgD family transcriptional regulator